VNNESAIVNSEWPAPTQSGAMVNLVVYDVLGREVATLVEGNQKPGRYEVIFDGSKYVSGNYFYILKAGDYTAAKKMMFLK
jgi:hypothetical protein